MSDEHKQNEDYIPALHSSRLTPVYDTLTRLTMRDRTFKECLIESASIVDGYRVLDLGCGTATLTVMVKQRYPGVEIIGFDPDRASIIYSVKKIYKAGLVVALMQGTASQLPFPSGSFDHVLSSLVFHHLMGENKMLSMREVFRVLKPGGELLLADFGKPHNFLMAFNSRITNALHDISDNLKEVVPEMMKEVGFSDVKQLKRFSTAFGTLVLYFGRKTTG